MRILITGGAGFIGHHLVRRALEDGHAVAVLDDFSSGHRRRLARFAGSITLIEGSVLDDRALAEGLRGSDVVLHEAAVASVAQSIAAPLWTNDVNVGGMIKLVLAAADHGVRRVVFAGSSAVYGNPLELPSREEQRPDPQSPYGASKLAAEHYLHVLGRVHGVETVALRYFNVFGPGQDPASEYSAVIPRFVTAVLAGQRPVINGSGEISRDFIYIDNVVDANFLAMVPGGPSALTCNIGAGVRTTLLELLEAIGEAAGRRLDPSFGPPRAGDVVHSQADIQRAVQTLGYRVAVPLKEGIARTVRSFREVEAQDGRH